MEIDSTIRLFDRYKLFSCGSGSILKIWSRNVVLPESLSWSFRRSYVPDGKRRNGKFDTRSTGRHNGHHRGKDVTLKLTIKTDVTEVETMRPKESLRHSKSSRSLLNKNY